MASGSIETAALTVWNRHTDTAESAAPRVALLPAVNWSAVGRSAPERIPLGARRPSDPLPHADIVVLTWTSAEWFALDHVFLNSDKDGDINDYSWRSSWMAFSRGAEDYAADPSSGKLWGEFALVGITDRSGRRWRVLLFKSNSHLAHAPWANGLSAMLKCILDDAKPDRIFTIGTAGGARESERLGDAVIANSAVLSLQRSQNTMDLDNGTMVRCPSWFPATSLVSEVENNLLYPMNRIVTDQSLEDMFNQLKVKNPDDACLAGMTVEDLTNDCIRPASLGSPRVRSLKDSAVLTTDFYYIAGGDSADTYSFLEMDDAIVGREAVRLGIRFACLRNISDPIVPSFTKAGKPISAKVRGDWSGLIYTTFGAFTSFNGALATWATIAGEGSAVYNPARASGTPDADDPLEVKLAYQVRSCGKCSFFWPERKCEQPYGPYTAFDFDVNTPYAAKATGAAGPSPWVIGRTRPPSFPNPEIVDGCRKAPIMTIGINPNLTAFLPGQTGAAWAYPNFSSEGNTDAWTKYAWYYRYRSVYQERLTLEFVKRFVLPEGRVIAERNGYVVSAARPTDAPQWTVNVRYEGDSADTVLTLPGSTGDFPYMLLFDEYAPNNKFAAGDIIAGKLAVPEGIQAEVLQQGQGYYLQFVPVLERFQTMLRDDDHTGASLAVGEDVCQLDMVACASPHWKAGFLGGAQESIDTIVDNCVSSTGWAMKQLIQTRPAVLYVVSIDSWKMFANAFGGHVKRDVPLSSDPADRDFTLLRETTDPDHPAYLEFDVTIGRQRYQSRTRLVITPHFSYNTNFLKQYRVSPDTWDQLKATQPACLAAMPEHGFTIVLPEPLDAKGYTAIRLPADAKEAAESQAWLKEQYPGVFSLLEPSFCDPHALMASVLMRMYAAKELTWTDLDDGRGFLSRNAGSCQFCVNRHWQFPNECRYGKTKEAPPPPGFLEKVAERVIATGKPKPDSPGGAA